MLSIFMQHPYYVFFASFNSLFLLKVLSILQIHFVFIADIHSPFRVPAKHSKLEVDTHNLSASATTVDQRPAAQTVHTERIQLCPLETEEDGQESGMELKVRRSSLPVEVTRGTLNPLDCDYSLTEQDPRSPCNTVRTQRSLSQRFSTISNEEFDQVEVKAIRVKKKKKKTQGKVHW